LNFVFFSSRRRHTRSKRDRSSDVCSSDLSLDAFYINYKNTLLNIVIFLFSIGITYYVSKRFYNAYYQQESKRELMLDKDEMKNYAIKGLKQLKIESYSSIVSLPISVFFYTIFFITGGV